MRFFPFEKKFEPFSGLLNACLALADKTVLRGHLPNLQTTAGLVAGEWDGSSTCVEEALDKTNELF